jgi:hypothetical protein
MSLDEMSCRGRQAVSKRLDRLLGGRARGASCQTGADGVQSWRQAADRFFTGAASDETPLLLTKYAPGDRERLLNEANALLEGRFDLLGYGTMSFGRPIDWHLDPTTGRRAPLLHWSLLDPLDSGTVGDSKVVWELNRHQWLVRLGQAYRLTGDGKYARAFTDSTASWMSANPRGNGINWASALEVAFRLISWCWALVLFHDSKERDSRHFEALLESLAAHARHVERYLSYYFSPNTHLTGEALALFYVGTLFPHMSRASRWRDLGRDILVTQAARQILPDGVYFEQSTAYQRYTAEIYLHFLILAERNQIDVPRSVQERLQRLLDALLVLRQPDGALPRIGDADGGWLMPLEPRSPDDARGVFSTAAAFFHRADYAWVAGGLAPEAVWLLGDASASAWEALFPAPPGQGPSSVLRHGGYVVMGSGWAPASDRVILDAGPLGCPLSAGHGHADLLSMQAFFRGEPYLVDPGTFRYTADEGWRDHFRGTSAHSTIEVDGVGQALPRGPFAWDSRPTGRLLRWTSAPTADVAIAEHAAYRRLADPVTHRRSVVLVKGRYCLVIDDLAGTTTHQVALRFQFAPMTVTLDSAGWVRAGRGSGPGLLLRSFGAAPLKTAIFNGDISSRQGWISPDYGQRVAAPVVEYSGPASFPLRLVTLLLPTECLLAEPTSVEPFVEDGLVSGLTFNRSSEIVRLADFGIERLPNP